MNGYGKLLAAGLLALLSQTAFAQGAPTLGTAADFALLSAAPGGLGAVTCTGSTVAGSVGSSGEAVSVVQTGCTIDGTIVAPISAQNLTDFNNAYDAFAAVSCDRVLTGTLADVVLPPGVSCFDAAATLTGTLTLAGSSTDEWIIKVGTGGTGALTSTNFSVVMANGALACNVYWWVAEAATMTTSDFKGTLLAGAAITSTGAGSVLTGRALAKSAVTVTGTSITGNCTDSGPGPGPGPKPRKCEDRVTGGGHIKAAQGKATFAITAGTRKDGFHGHLVYGDKGSDLKVKGTGVTSYVVTDARTRSIEGTAMINGVVGTYKVVASDNGEPGRKDSFTITLSTGYTATGNLSGGNIQIHKHHCGKGHGHKKGKHGHHDRDDSDGDRCDHDDRNDDRDDDRGGGDRSPFGSKGKSKK